MTIDTSQQQLINSLKQQISDLEQQQPPLQEAVNSAKDALKVSEDNLGAAIIVTGQHQALQTLHDARHALAADPTNPDLQNAYQTASLNEKNITAQLAPYIQATNDAYTASLAANQNLIANQDQITNKQLRIAEIDPTQATPEAVAYLNETKESTPTVPDGGSASVSSDNKTVTVTNADGTEQTYTNTPPTNFESTTNPSASDQATLQKYTEASAANPNNLDEITVTASRFTPSKVSAEPFKPKAVEAKFGGKTDQRVRLIVPKYYLSKMSEMSPRAGKILSNNSGIVFPYTPSFSIDHTVNYSAFNAMHSNYTQHFYKNTAVGDITLTGAFTVQNDDEAGILLAVIHLLRGLIKMRAGDDDNAGSPPPVCKLYAYGTYMFDKTPVVIKNFSVDLPNNVDYYTCSSSQGFGISSVPVHTNLKLTLSPIYSRRELLTGTVKGWFSGQRSEGYL
jgi:hypothetical protein